MKFYVMSIACDTIKKSQEMNNLKEKHKYVLNHNI
jgi:hypothetical protein